MAKTVKKSKSYAGADAAQHKRLLVFVYKLWLRHYSANEIAEVLPQNDFKNVSVSTVRRYIDEARATLKSHYEERGTASLLAEAEARFEHTISKLWVIADNIKLPGGPRVNALRAILEAETRLAAMRGVTINREAVEHTGAGGGAIKIETDLNDDDLRRIARAVLASNGGAKK